ncbi:MAG: hypothetical protein QOE64_2683 [Frankiales bacterium]|nr:hypothetical protein [Frankiales bacterium]
MAWLAWTADHARRDLVAVRSGLPAVTAALRAGDGPAASRALTVIQGHARSAEQNTSDPLWWAVSKLPVVGRTPAQVRGVSAAVHQLTQETLPTAILIADKLRPSRVRPAEGQVDVGVVAASAADAHRAARTSGDVLKQLRATPSHGLLASVDAARLALLAEVRRAHDALSAVDLATHVLPQMLGNEGTKRYFVAFQNNAEARATGGLVGSYAILQADHGKLTLAHVGSARELPLTAKPVVELGAEYDARYRSQAPARDIRNSNASPHFPYAAQIWQGLWQQRTGEQLDGAFAVDPVAASYVLGATGSVVLGNGRVVTGSSLVDLVESRSYAEISDSAVRDQFQSAVASAVFKRIVRARADQVHGLLTALAKAAGEGRVLAYSNTADVEQRLSGTRVAGVLAEQTGPFAGVVITNAAGSKLDYYLRRSVRYEASACGASRRISQVRVRLANTAPGRGLPSYVTVRADVTGKPPPAGTERLLVSLYATPGAQLLSVTQDGLRIGAVSEHERGHPVFTVDVEIPPSSAITLAYTVDEPSLHGAPQVPLQPLVDDPGVSVRVPVCS